jgi:hypothetical protein
MSIKLDDLILSVAKDVYDKLLSKPYTEVGELWEYDHRYPQGTLAKGPGHNLQRFIIINEKKLHRPIHGLAHTMRTLMYSQLIHAAAIEQSHPHRCRDGRTIADISQEQLLKLNIAQLFFVAGRKSEASYSDAYQRYHYYGAYEFTQYAIDNLSGLFNEDEIENFARCIEDRKEDFFDQTPESYLMHLSHMVDLMRCKSPVEVFLGQNEGCLGFVPTLINLFGKRVGLDIMYYARGLFEASGEGVFYIDSTEWDKLGVANEKVQKAQQIMGAIIAPGIEADAKKTAMAGFSVDDCYSALTSVTVPDWYINDQVEQHAKKSQELSPLSNSKQDHDKSNGHSLWQRVLGFFNVRDSDDKKHKQHEINPSF